MLKFIILWVICCVVVAWWVLISPEGYEDETGFHYGETNISTNAAFTAYEERRDLYEQQEFNKEVFNLLGMWLRILGWIFFDVAFVDVVWPGVIMRYG